MHKNKKQHLRQNEVTEEHVPEKKKKIEHQKKNEVSGDRQYTQEGVQGSGCKDDQRAQEKNECTE